MPGFDLKQINRNDQGILGAGILFLLLSFFAPFYGASYHEAGFGGSASWSAWHSYGWLGVLLIIIAVGIVAARVFGNMSLPSLPVGPNLLVAALATLGTLILLLRGFTYKTASGPGYSVGQKWGAYVLYVLAIAIIVFAFLNFKMAGEKLAWDQSAMPARPAGGATPTAPTYPPQGAAPTYPPATPPAAEYPPSSDPGTPGV